MQSWVKGFNVTFNWGSQRRSFYSTNRYSVLPYFNPMNYIGLKTCAKFFGMSSDFYREIVVPHHGLSMTGVDIDDLPATSFPVLEDMSPVLQALPPGKSLSWGTGNS